MIPETNENWADDLALLLLVPKLQFGNASAFETLFGLPVVAQSGGSSSLCSMLKRGGESRIIY
jgi:hypothetical protein